jgi:hypothetical protein
MISAYPSGDIPSDYGDEREAVPMPVRSKTFAFNEKIGGIS